MDQPTAMANENAKDLSPAQRSALDRIAALRNPEAHYLVYKLTGPTGKIYIGYTGNSLQRRWGGAYQKAREMRKDMDTYGRSSFKKEVLCEHLTREGAEHLEYELIERLHATDPRLGYNCRAGGRIHVTPSPRSVMRLRSSLCDHYAQHPEARAKLSAQLKQFYDAAPDLVELCRTRSKEAKPLRCRETGESFRSLKFAAKQMRIDRHTLRTACNDPYATCCGFHWQWL